MCDAKVYSHVGIGCYESPAGSRRFHRSGKVLTSDRVEDDIKSKSRCQTLDILLDLFFPKVNNFIGPQAAHQIEIFVCSDRCSNLTSQHFCELDSDMTY